MLVHRLAVSNVALLVLAVACSEQAAGPTASIQPNAPATPADTSVVGAQPGNLTYRVGTHVLQSRGTTRPWNPGLLTAALVAVDGRGRIPLADIALRSNQPLPADLAAMGYPLFGVDNEIAASTKWDSRL